MLREIRRVVLYYGLVRPIYWVGRILKFWR